MAWTWYKSTDAGTSTPTVNGVTGSLLTLFDAVLVNGYGSKPAAGWTKAYTGTNVTVYASSGTNGFTNYLRVDDSGPGAWGGREARVRGYSAISGTADSGTFGIPSSVASANGYYVSKSEAADSVAVPWHMFADEKTLVLVTNGGTTLGWRSFYFGDYYSYNPGVHPCIIVARDAEASNSATYNRLAQNSQYPYDGKSGHVIMQDPTYAYAGSSSLACEGGRFQTSTSSPYARSDQSVSPVFSFPMLYTGEVSLERLTLAWIATSPKGIIGRVRGVYAINHARGTFPHGLQVAGSGDLAGKSFVLLNDGTTGAMAYETSNTVEGN